MRAAANQRGWISGAADDYPHHVCRIHTWLSREGFLERPATKLNDEDGEPPRHVVAVLRVQQRLVPKFFDFVHHHNILWPESGGYRLDRGRATLR